MGVPLFFLLRRPLGVSAAALVMTAAMLPAFLLAMYEKNGQPLEKILENMISACFLRPKQRPYETKNFYALLERQDQLDKEVLQIVRNRQKAHPKREKTDRRGRGAGEGKRSEAPVRPGLHSL